MKIIMGFVFVGLTLINFACTSKVDSPTLSYQFSHDGCTTGLHQPATIQELCTALQDEVYNNTCAQREREDKFKKYCPGAFKPSLKSYTFGDQSCETGRQAVSSLEDLCKALQDETGNLHCRLAEREAYFRLEHCKGTFKSTKSDQSQAADDDSSTTSVLSNVDCEGYYIAGGAIIPISWSARDLTDNEFPEIPDHSSIVLTCNQQDLK